ncbi:MAG: sulfotransferase [Candidatus Lokiarchaeia archaeon]|nr:sulfotransferase [Candidatus Lokiarchaeia archaeon]
MKSKNQNPHKFPLVSYAGYGITKFFNSFKSISLLLDKIETMFMHNDIKKINIDRPIYITGLARAGTTIILEMLDKHPELASHKYQNVLMPYLPDWFSEMAKKFNLYEQPFERLHRDGIFVNRESPEAVEEAFWLKFFKNLHNENVPTILTKSDSNPKFEKFYKTHLKKLIINQKCQRYLAKNNYLVTRLDYLLKIFPDSKILLIIRNPEEHIASLIKQSKLFRILEQENPLLPDWLKIVGHNEFGRNQICINVGNTDLINEIHKLWRKKKTYVKGWAYYWTSIYNFIANQIETNKNLKKATLIIKYDELCETPEIVIDKIIDHTELSTEKFEVVKKYYCRNLHKPTYYSPNFSKQECSDISDITEEIKSRFQL